MARYRQLRAIDRFGENVVGAGVQSGQFLFRSRSGGLLLRRRQGATAWRVRSDAYCLSCTDSRFLS